MNPKTFTIGMAKTVPLRRAGESDSATPRAISTPSNSSPWIAPLIQTKGPGRAPWITSTGRLSHSPVT